jgi:hypothetical protein
MKWFRFLLVLGLSTLGVAMVLAQEPATSLPQPSLTEAGASFALTADTPITTPLLTEDFEGLFPPSGWLNASLSPGGPWGQSDARVHGGDFSALHNDDPSHLECDTWLVTPQVTPTASSELVFWQNENYAFGYVKHSIWVSTACQDPKECNFTQLVDLGPGTEDTWEEVRVELRPYAGQPVYLAFRYEGTFADEWYVDDVQVTTGLFVTNDGPTPLGESTTLTASVATGRNVTFTWDLGDESTVAGAIITHTYPALGTYTAVVTASNDAGVITGTTTISVRAFVYLPLVLK